MKCICNTEMEIEDNIADTDKGTFGELSYYCPKCQRSYNQYGDEL